ncbi:MFS transporter [Haloechinothrix sp. YIM 98757]|uniref:MFS transporter n=1 Tax=Haloechinothrix aidingensis TaxID=2752311 RepID=A0A838AG46_9PSEU|nr:MFS transporter [Haloechinothrix aidingensis]MBA0128259.1 MFS transporter [Haloechinothrix aidingensis]
MSGRADPAVQEIHDFYGRRYRVGETDRQLTGRSRTWMLLAACLAMLVASVGQYGFGMMMPKLGVTHGWTLAQSGWVLAIWILCQSATVYVGAELRSRWNIAPGVTLALGALLCATGLVTLGTSTSLTAAMLGHGVLGGTGAGLIYGTCLGVVAKWYPERTGRTASVSGAFAYGAIPFIVLAGYFAGPASIEVFLVLAGAAVVVLVGIAAATLREPPADWWPSHIDPRAWALDKSVNPGLRNNRPAVRRYTASEILRCPTSALLFLAVTCATAVALCTIGYLAVFVTGSGRGSAFAVLALSLFVAASGVTRTAAGWASEHAGRDRVVRLALYGGAAGQLAILLGGEYGFAALLLLGAVLAGAGAGACYAVLPDLVEGYFGERPGLPNFGIFYGAKAVGGLVGVALAGHLVGGYGFPVVLLVAVVFNLAGAVMVRQLRQAGRHHVALPTSAAPRHSLT